MIVDDELELRTVNRDITIAKLLGWTQVEEKTAKINPIGCGEFVFCISSMDGDTKLYRRHRDGGDFYEFQPHKNIKDAWIIFEYCCNLIFSRRRKFFEALDYNLCHRDGFIIAYPDAMMFLSPEVICQSFLEAF